jgi:IS30 family transposase
LFDSFLNLYGNGKQELISLDVAASRLGKHPRTIRREL